MDYKITVAPGDGIGPEITDVAVKVLDKIGEIYNHKFDYEDILIGGASIDKYGVPLTDEAVEIAKASDGILLGAVGGWKWDNIDAKLRPEQGLLKLRKELQVYSNLRPAIIYKELRDASPLKNEILGDGIDILVVRELVGGIYFGERKTFVENGIRTAYDVEKYNEEEIRRIAIIAFESAMKRRKKVTSVDKANVLDASKLWRAVVEEVAKDYPEVELEHLYIDNAAMQVVRDPRQFDVILTNNIFGDILSDEISQITGSIGMLPSASLGDKGPHLYEPIHGSAPDIAGKNLANPLATILSVAMMLRYSFDMEKEARAIEQGVEKALEKGYRTGDIAAGKESIGCVEMGEVVLREIEENN